DVTSGALAADGDLTFIDAEWIAQCSHRFPEIPDTAFCVLDSPVGSIDKCSGSGVLVTERIPAQAVIHSSDDVSFFCKLRTHLHDSAVRFVAGALAVDRYRQKTTGVKVEDQRPVGGRIAGRCIHVHGERIHCRTAGNNGDVVPVHDIGYYIHGAEYRVEVAGLRAGFNSGEGQYKQEGGL